jgi:hypothetical protein
MRARIGFMALWAALLVWAMGASMQVPGEVAASPGAAVVQSIVPVAPAAPPAHVDLERAAAWPRESAESWQAPSQASEQDLASEPTPEEEAALYIAGR